MQRDRHVVRLRTRPYRRRHRATRPACCALAHEALLSSPLCNATGMSCACARGLIVVAIVQRDRHVVRLRTRPYRRCHRVTRPACRALAHKALLLLPSCDATGMLCACARGLIVVAIVQRDRNVVRLRTRPYRRRHRATRPACCALAHEALSLSPSCDATGMSCACAQGLIVVAIVRRDRHVVRLRTRPYRRRHRATRPACRALAHQALSLSPSCDATGMPCACARGLIVVAIV
jgi:hypothetical protein